MERRLTKMTVTNWARLSKKDALEDHQHHEWEEVLRTSSQEVHRAYGKRLVSRTFFPDRTSLTIAKKQIHGREAKAEPDRFSPCSERLLPSRNENDDIRHDHADPVAESNCRKVSYEKAGSRRSTSRTYSCG